MMLAVGFGAIGFPVIYVAPQPGAPPALVAPIPITLTFTGLSCRARSPTSSSKFTTRPRWLDGLAKS
jgi:hypothetical protein